MVIPLWEDEVRLFTMSKSVFGVKCSAATQKYYLGSGYPAAPDPRFAKILDKEVELLHCAQTN